MLGELIVVYAVTLGPIWQEEGWWNQKATASLRGDWGPAGALPSEHFSKKKKFRKKVIKRCSNTRANTGVPMFQGSSRG